MILRDYQVRAIDEVRQSYRTGHRRPLLVSPCGSGKTVIFSHIGKSAAERGKRVMILVHRQELIDQVSAALDNCAVPHGIIAASHDRKLAGSVTVASVMTLIRRVKQTKAPDLLIIDEAHHAVSDSWGAIIRAYPTARLLGVTATPTRTSGQGLGDVFDDMIYGPGVRELTDAGHLAPARVFAPPTIDTTGMHTLMGDYLKSEIAAAVDKPKVTGDAIEHYQKLTPGRKAVVFCVSLEHAGHMARAAREAGITAVEMDGRMDREVRRRIVRDFVAGAIQWLVTVDIVAEGFDVPDIEVGIFLRPTQSMGLWLQQSGRVLRTAPGKTEAVCLDHAGNTLRHGLPSDDREWSLEGRKRDARAPSESAASIRVCPQCFSAQLSGKPTCMHCGCVFEVKARQVQREEGTLTEITPEQIARRRERQLQGRATSLEQLQAIGRIKGYKPGWAQRVFEARQKKRVAS